MTSTETEPAMSVMIDCQECGKPHVGDYAGQSQFDKDTPIYAVICTDQTINPAWLTDYYTDELAYPVPPTPDLGLELTERNAR